MQPARLSLGHSLKRNSRTTNAQRWAVELDYPPLTRAQAAPFLAHMVAQRGRYDTFTWVPPRPLYDPLGLWTREKYLSLPGVSGNYASTPDSAANSITGDIDIRVKVAMDDWTPSSQQGLLSKFTTVNQRSYLFEVDSDGTLIYRFSPNGTDAAVVAISSTAATGFSNGAVRWVRVTHDVNNGAAGHDVRFYTSTDGESWTQLGTTVTTAGATSIHDSSDSIEIYNTAYGVSPLAGKVYRALIYNGIAGTLAVDFDASRASTGDTTFTAATGEVWTINSSGSPAPYISVDTGIVVNAGSQTGRSINLKGLAPDRTALGKAGDLLKFANHTKVYMVTADFDTAANGTAAVSIDPALIVSPSDLEIVTVDDVPFTMALAEDTLDFEQIIGPLYNLRASLVEAY